MKLSNFLNYNNLPTTNREMGTAPNRTKTIPEHITKNTNVTNTKIISHLLTRSNADTTKFKEHACSIIRLLFGHSNIILDLSYYVIIRWWRSSCCEQNHALTRYLSFKRVEKLKFTTLYIQHYTYVDQLLYALSLSTPVARMTARVVIHPAQTCIIVRT